MQKYVLSELDSGERVISERTPGVRSVAIGFWIGAGSRDETDAKAGVSHFIEHLLFKGSRTYTAQQIAEIFDGLGGELNAATSREHTMVYARVPDAQVQTALNLMTDMVFAPAFTDLDSERDVVLEEIAMYDDTPQELVHDLFSEAVFGRHALGRPVIGTADVISSVTKRVLSTYHRQMYAGGNVVIAAAGNVEHNKFIRMLADAHTAGKANVAVVALSAAGKHQAGSYFDDLDAFRDHLAAIDLARLEILKPMAYFDISFPDWCIEADDAMAALEKQIHDILFPQSQFTWEDYCEENGLDPSFSPRGDWRKFKCDVQSMWAHTHNKRDVFVSVDDNFCKPDKTSALVALGAGHIERPQQAVALI